MKKGLVVIASTLLFQFVATTPNAEMKITPNGVTTPDESAALHLSGSFTTGDYLTGPDGAVISAINTFSNFIT